MGMLHIQFNRDSRIELAILLTAGKSQTECGRILGICRTNVCLEINRNKDADGVYRGVSAHKKYLKRRKKSKEKSLKIKNNPALKKHIKSKLKLKWSPEQISGRLQKNGMKHVVHETIYTYIYKSQPEWCVYLRCKKNKYRRKRGSIARIQRNKASKIKLIDERDPIVDLRTRIGDWEGDTVVGKEKTQRILTYVERKTGYAKAIKLDVVSAEIVQEKTVSIFKYIPKEKRLTLTRDNGVEFGDFDTDLELKTRMQVYRAHPYHSWERGTNENWNGLLREFFPKGMLFASITQYDINRAVQLLNDRPRKRLGYATPREVFGCYVSD
jgi:IS30 family transposase